MFGALLEIRNRVGKQKFPLIDQNYYSSYKQMVISPTFPSIMKISHAHRGMGKVRMTEYENFRDLATVVALNGDYCTAEPFIEAEYGIRVQKIGNSYRVYKKVHTGSGWKSQFGGSDLQEIPLTDEYKLWADECSKCYGGMDLLAVDAVHGKDGKDYILELNGTAIGLGPEFENDDLQVIRDLVLEKLQQRYSKTSKPEQKQLKGEEEVQIAHLNLQNQFQHLQIQNQHLEEELKQARAQLRQRKPTADSREGLSKRMRGVLAIGLCVLLSGLAYAVVKRYQSG